MYVWKGLWSTLQCLYIPYHRALDVTPLSEVDRVTGWKIPCEVWSKAGSGLNFERQCEPYSAHKFHRRAEKHVMQRSLFCAVCPEQRGVWGGGGGRSAWVEFWMKSSRPQHRGAAGHKWADSNHTYNTWCFSISLLVSMCTKHQQHWLLYVPTLLWTRRSPHVNEIWCLAIFSISNVNPRRMCGSKI